MKTDTVHLQFSPEVTNGYVQFVNLVCLLLHRLLDVVFGVFNGHYPLLILLAEPPQVACKNTNISPIYSYFVWNALGSTHYLQAPRGLLVVRTVARPPFFFLGRNHTFALFESTRGSRMKHLPANYSGLYRCHTFFLDFLLNFYLLRCFFPYQNLNNFTC